MVKSCVAFGCVNRNTPQNRQRGITFHMFPFSDNDRLQKWTTALRRIGFIPTEHSVICSEHFLAQDFAENSILRILKPTAVPSMFNFPAHLKSRLAIPRTTFASQGGYHKSADSQGASSSSTTDENIESSGAVPEIYPSKRNDHTYATMDSPRKLKNQLDAMRDDREKVAALLMAATKREKRAKLALSSVLEDLRHRQLISEKCVEMLKAYRDIPLDLFVHPDGEGYTDEQRQFAITLHFYGAKGYNYLRQHLHLPCERTISRWLRNIDGNPGFSQQALIALRTQHERSPSEYTLCTLVIDGMSIRSQVDWDQNSQSMVGFVNLGFGNSSLADDQDVAKEAVVFLAVGLLGHWKIALGYFLINGITADVQQRLVEQAIQQLHAVGMKVVALTMDGLASNQAMAKGLGCSLDPDNLKSSFTNPADPVEQIFVSFDACHCLKLLRGTLHQYQSLLLPDNRLVQFHHFTKLVEVQEESGLRAANKLTRRHIEFQRQKMKVKFAAQIFSNSVAKALELARELGIEGLMDSSATQYFCKLVNDLFDCLNSRSLHGQGMKHPLTIENMHERHTFLMDSINTLLALRTADGKVLICKSPRRMAVVGFSISILSAVALAERYLSSAVGDKVVKFILTYKLSQDHLEIFFSCIRVANGTNNNPTAKQLRAIMRKLLFRAGVSPSDSSNVLPQDDTGLLHVSGSKCDATASCDNGSLVTTPDSLEDHSYAIATSTTVLTPFVKSICGYIAGWVVRKLLATLKCAECAMALTDPANPGHRVCYSLIEIKDYGMGGLVCPSADVIKVVMLCEKVLRCETNIQGAEHLPKNFTTLVEMAILKDLPKDAFKPYQSHFYDTAYGCDSHLYSLVRLLCRTYVNVRLHHLCKMNNLSRAGNYVRHWNNKQTLFRNQ